MKKNLIMRKKDGMVKFQIASDLHIEFQNDSVPNPLSLITPSADILVLAGDVGSLYKHTQLEGFMKKLCSLFQVVLYHNIHNTLYCFFYHIYYRFSFRIFSISLNDVLISFINSMVALFAAMGTTKFP